MSWRNRNLLLPSTYDNSLDIGKQEEKQEEKQLKKEVKKEEKQAKIGNVKKMKRVKSSQNRKQLSKIRQTTFPLLQRNKKQKRQNEEIHVQNELNIEKISSQYSSQCRTNKSIFSSQQVHNNNEQRHPLFYVKQFQNFHQQECSQINNIFNGSNRIIILSGVRGCGKTYIVENYCIQNKNTKEEIDLFDLEKQILSQEGRVESIIIGALFDVPQQVKERIVLLENVDEWNTTHFTTLCKILNAHTFSKSKKKQSTKMNKIIVTCIDLYHKHVISLMKLKPHGIRKVKVSCLKVYQKDELCKYIYDVEKKYRKHLTGQYDQCLGAKKFFQSISSIYDLSTLIVKFHFEITSNAYICNNCKVSECDIYTRKQTTIKPSNVYAIRSFLFGGYKRVLKNITGEQKFQNWKRVYDLNPFHFNRHVIKNIFTETSLQTENSVEKYIEYAIIDEPKDVSFVKTPTNTKLETIELLEYCKILDTTSEADTGNSFGENILHEASIRQIYSKINNPYYSLSKVKSVDYEKNIPNNSLSNRDFEKVCEATMMYRITAEKIVENGEQNEEQKTKYIPMNISESTLTKAKAKIFAQKVFEVDKK